LAVHLTLVVMLAEGGQVLVGGSRMVDVFAGEAGREAQLPEPVEALGLAFGLTPIRSRLILAPRKRAA